MMPSARVVRGGWCWRGRYYESGDIVDASDAQLAAWAAEGLVERVSSASPPERQRRIERATAPPPAEAAVDEP